MSSKIEIKVTPTMKHVLNFVNGDIGYDVRYTATEIACAVMPAGWSMSTLYSYVDKVHDLAAAGLIFQHDNSFFHANEGMCLDCDPSYN